MNILEVIFVGSILSALLSTLSYFKLVALPAWFIWSPTFIITLLGISLYLLGITVDINLIHTK